MHGGQKKILFVCGSINQTTQLHQISTFLPEFDNWFTPYFADGYVDLARKLGLLEGTILGNKLVRRCLDYLEANGLQVDSRGARGGYDLVVTCADVVVPKRIAESTSILVQEGMTDPEGILYRLVKALPFLPRWIASTSTYGLSDAYDIFCVASEGYRDFFARKGVRPEKMIVTGIPNFDNCSKYLLNDFPHKKFVLVCTSDARETLQYENRKKTILDAVRIAAGRPLIFKLHPNEDAARATREINRWAPGALVYTSGKAEEMVANCDVLITRYSSVVYVGLALGKEVYSAFDVDELRRLTPLQNASAARNIAGVCRSVLESPGREGTPVVRKFRRNLRWSKANAYNRVLRRYSRTGQ